jgi:hypothetical protein
MMVATQLMEQAIMPSKTTQTDSSINVDYHALKKAALVLRALNHKLRQQLKRKKRLLLQKFMFVYVLSNL